MIDPVGDPAAMRAKADELRRTAGALADLVTGLAAKVDAMVFVGPAGDRVREEMRLQRSVAQRSYATLVQVAARLDSTASSVEAEIHARRVAEVRRLAEGGGAD